MTDSPGPDVSAAAETPIFNGCADNVHKEAFIGEEDSAVTLKLFRGVNIASFHKILTDLWVFWRFYLEEV